MPQFHHYITRMYSMMGGFQSGERIDHHQSSRWHPPVNIYERADSVLIVMELPGITKDQISIQVREDTLEVTGIRPARAPEGTRRVLQMEIPDGPFERFVKLPPDTRPDSIGAEYTDGFLVIEIKREESA